MTASRVSKLALIFTLAAGVTTGGVIGFGYLSRGDKTAKDSDAPKTEKTVVTPSANSIEAEIVAVESDSAIVVRAHIWPGQYKVTHISPADNFKHPRPADMEAVITDHTGRAVTSFKKAQTVYLKSLTPTASTHTAHDITADIPEGRPQNDILRTNVEARVVRVIDGDTFEAVAEIWPGVSVVTYVRLGGIDTPEKKGRAKCSGEADLAATASAFTESLIEGKTVTLTNVSFEKYGGRVLADVTLENGQNLSATLVQKGYARSYDGGKKSSWCN